MLMDINYAVKKLSIELYLKYRSQYFTGPLSVGEQITFVLSVKVEHVVQGSGQRTSVFSVYYEDA
jgi:hypothetical protein